MILFTGPINPAEIVNQLFPNFWILLAHIIAATVLILLLTKWVYNPFRKAMRARRKLIQSIISEARTNQSVANRNNILSESKLKNAKNDAAQIVKDAKLEASDKKNVILNQAREEIQALREHGKKTLISEREQMQEDIRQSIVDISFQIAKETIKKELSKKDHEKLVEDLIKEI